LDSRATSCTTRCFAFRDSIADEMAARNAAESRGECYEEDKALRTAGCELRSRLGSLSHNGDCEVWAAAYSGRTGRLTTKNNKSTKMGDVDPNPENSWDTPWARNPWDSGENSWDTPWFPKRKPGESRVFTKPGQSRISPGESRVLKSRRAGVGRPANRCALSV
jgi:hypothetical protein